MKKSILISILFILFINIHLADSKILIGENNVFSNELNSNNDNNDGNNNKFLGKINKISNHNINFTSLELDNSSNWFNLKIANYFTYLHLILSFLIIPILSIILIFIDMNEDKSIKANLSLPSNMKVKNEYNLFKNTYIIRAKYLFSWLLFKYHYPITNIFFIYHYNHPRYIRLILFVIELLFNTLITAVLLISIFNYILIDDAFICFIFSFIVSIIMKFIISYIYRYLFEFHSIRREIFKNKLEILRKYIYYIVKKDILFNSKWNSIRNRMFTYYRVCGSLLLKQVKRNKYQRYVKNKYNNSNQKYKINSSFNDKSFNSSFSSNSNNKTMILKELNEMNINEINTYESKDKNINQKQTASSFPKIENKLKNKYEEKINEKEKRNKFRISKGVDSFSFSKFGINNMKLKTVKRIEDIRNRYINKKKDIKFDETMEIDKDIKIFENLDIESLEGFTYISTDSMIDKLNNIKMNSNKLIINILTGVILIIILILINLSLMMLQMGEIANHESSHIREILLIIIICIFVINYFIHRLVCIFIAFSLPNFYGKKKRNCCYKLIFDIFYEKYIRYLYRIRLLITKYQKELNFIEK